MPPRLFVLTDISNEEPDDLQSLIRLLLHSDEIEIEGLVATLSEWKIILGTPFRPDLIHRALDAYARCFANLRRHSATYPEPDSLRARIAVGNGNDLVATGGPEHDTPGATLLADAILRADPRPLWVAIWGGAATLAQAVRMLARRLAPPELAAALARVWVYEIQGQDDCGAWLAVHHPALKFIRSQLQWRGISNRVDKVWPETTRHLDEYVERRWFDRHIREGHGPLGELYPDARFLFEGDTPSLLHLVPNGLHDPVEIHQGGWGGRFEREKRRNVWSGGCPVNDEARWGDFGMFSDAADGLLVAGNGKVAHNVYNPLRRWRDAYQNAFAARMDRCLGAPGEVNRAPVAVIDGDASRAVLRLPLRRGERLTLDASASADPDGGPVAYRWWHYAEPGSFGARVEIHDPDQARCTLIAAPDSAPGECHLILELTDAGEPPLKAYRRVILDLV